MRHLRRNACFVVREGRKHTLVESSKNGVRETVPRHSEIDNVLVKKICRRLQIEKPV